jgi:hypothetical protein
MNAMLRVMLLASVPAFGLGGQHRDHAPLRDARRDSLAVMATVLSTTATPALAGRRKTDVQVTQPMLSVRGARADGALQYSAMLNAERWTMPDGEPVAGIWGEGFIDRRHPHTVVHEAMLTGVVSRMRWRASLAGGKGFVPFGTDDPMVRPFTKYPANHHLSQVMERLQLVLAGRIGARVAFEGAVFNGDEPLDPTSAPQWDRFGDSRAARVTVWPTRGWELQGSAAAVRSPEFLRPDGLDHAKLHSSARWIPSSGPMQYALVEWARTDERYRGRRIIEYGSLLSEAQVRWHAWVAAARAEQTTRPEDERLLDPFRTTRPPNHLIIQGLTQWRIGTVVLARDLPPSRYGSARAFVEVAHATSTPRLRPVLLDPRDIIGADAAWHITLGLRASIGAMPARVGRYGAAVASNANDAMLGMRHDP